MTDNEPQEQKLNNAVAAGWNPADGDPPFEHGEPVPPLASSANIEDLIPEQERPL